MAKLVMYISVLRTVPRLVLAKRFVASQWIPKGHIDQNVLLHIFSLLSHAPCKSKFVSPFKKLRFVVGIRQHVFGTEKHVLTTQQY